MLDKTKKNEHTFNMFKSLAMVLSFALISPMNYAVGESVCVLTNSANLYLSPDFSSEIVVELSKDDELTLIDKNQIDGFYYVSFQDNDAVFKGYVFNECVGVIENSQESILSYNATILNDTDVYSISTNETLCKVKKGTRVFLYEGYDKEKDLLAIKFENEGKIIVGYVQIEDVKPDGVNYALIVSITAIVALVSIIIILLNVSKKKRHKKLKTLD